MPVQIHTLQDIPVAGIQKLTTIDYPGHLSAVLFLAGCPWRCRYCHNPALQGSGDERIEYDDLASFLDERRGFVEGIVVSGGEPTGHAALPDLLRWIRDFGYRVALHTNGFFPDMLSHIIGERLVDYIAVDVKGPPRAYDRIAGASGTCMPVSKSIDMVASSGIEFEFRTTFHPTILSEGELLQTMEAAARKNAGRYYVQMFRKDGVCDDELVRGGDIVTVPASVIMLGEKLFRDFGVR